MKDTNDLSAFAQIETLQEFTGNGTVQTKLRVLAIAIIGIIYALLYIGDCIKETKMEEPKEPKYPWQRQSKRIAELEKAAEYILEAVGSPTYDKPFTVFFI